MADQIWMEIGKYIIGLLVSGVLGTVIAFVLKKLPVADLEKVAAEAKIAEQQIAQKKGIAWDCVLLVEDIFTESGGPAKLKQAITKITEKFNALGVPYTSAEVEELARTAYQQIVAQFGKNWSVVPTV
jgi:hypothetical protein